MISITLYFVAGGVLIGGVFIFGLARDQDQNLLGGLVALVGLCLVAAAALFRVGGMCIVGMLLVLGSGYAGARDLDGRYAQSTLKPWFDNLKSKSGDLCCSDADGTAISDADWRSRDGAYEVFLDGEWRRVPDSALVTVPNRVGRTMVWPRRGASGFSIACFMPGPMT